MTNRLPGYTTAMYIGIGTLVLVLVIIMLILLLRGRTV
jgi:hypothetical protein